MAELDHPGAILAASADLLRRVLLGAATPHDGMKELAAFDSASRAAGWAALGPEGLRAVTEQLFGGMLDGIGLAAPRGAAQALQEWAQCESARQAAGGELNAWMAQVWANLHQRVVKPGWIGPENDSAAELQRWTAIAAETMHEAMQSPEGLALFAKLALVNASSVTARQRVSEHCARALGLPTISDFDDATLQIAELRRELRRLKTELQAPGATVRARSRHASASGSARKTA
jgi:hypothetical protein